MSIHHNLEQIKAVALEYAKQHNCNYNVIIHNPNDKGEFDMACGSTYEFVVDSYFETERPNIIRLYKTDDDLKKKLTLSASELPLGTHITGDLVKGYEEIKVIQKEIEALDATFNHDEKGKLKKGLSIHPVQADGVRYMQGSSGLQRISNTNRNDKCNCGSGKKFKHCHGK